nr:MAG TPA: hypothetical protein [Caudoviricetes sp.]
MVISGYFRFGNTSSCRCSCSLAKGCNQCGSLVLLREFQTCVLILAVNVSIPMIVKRINYALRVVLSCTNNIALVLRHLIANRAKSAFHRRVYEIEALLQGVGLSLFASWFS